MLFVKWFWQTTRMVETLETTKDSFLPCEASAHFQQVTDNRNGIRSLKPVADDVVQHLASAQLIANGG
jgi:hypothetical protein